MNANKIPEALNVILSSGRVPLLKSNPGQSKSTQVHEYAQNNNLKLIDIRLSQIEPYDLLGLVGHENGKLIYYPPANIPLISDKISKKYDGYLLFLDELLQGSEEVQKAAFKLVYDRKIGDTDIHPSVQIVAATNHFTKGMGTIGMNAAFNNRFVHLDIDDIDTKDWLKWAYRNAIHPTIISFLHVNPEMLNTYSADEVDDNPYASPRTYEFLSDNLKQMRLSDSQDELLKEIVIGNIGPKAGVIFLVTIDNLDKLPTIKQILNKPNKAKVPKKQHQYGVIGMISEVADKDNIAVLSKYISRLHIDIQFLVNIAIIEKDRKLYSSKPIKKWVKKNNNFLVW